MFASLSRFVTQRKFRRSLYIVGVFLLGLAVIAGSAVRRSDDPPVDLRPILPDLLAPRLDAATPPRVPARTESAARPPKAEIPPAIVDALTLPGEAREEALINLVREWAARDPEHAFVWAKTLRQPEHTSVIETILDTLGDKPGLALRLGRELLRQELDQSADYGSILIAALNREENFTAALEFANSSGAETNRTGWTATVVEAWARAQPTAAPHIAAVVSKPGVPDEVLNAFVAGWANSAPASAAGFAMTLPLGETRQTAVSEALGIWISQEPKSAADWIDKQLDGSPEFDQALATLLTQADETLYTPKSALERVNTISDPTLRADTRATLMQRWADSDRQAALNYLQLAPDVKPEERMQLFAALTQPLPVAE